MRTNKITIICLFAALILSSCTGKKKGVFTPTSSGLAYELLVVIEDDMWERPAGRALFAVLDTDVPGLPQSERSFRIMNTPEKYYDATLKLLRNIIVVEDNPKRYTQAKFSVSRDVYASPQTILTIQAPDEESMKDHLEQHGQAIIDAFTKAEMNRQIALLENQHNDFVSTKTKEMFDVEVWVPGELMSFKTGEDFFWASTNKATADMNFIIYSYPYVDKETFTEEYLIHKRDSVMKINIPGAREGMYMTTDTRFVIGTPIVVQKEYAFELRGLWRVEGDAMGGPFVSHTRLDKKNQRIITAEIFIFAPDRLKRNLVRQMEASLYTLRLPSLDEVKE